MPSIGISPEHRVREFSGIPRGPGRRRVALFLRSLDEQFQTTVLKGISAEAARLDVDLVVIQTDSLPTPPLGNPDNILFSLPSFTRFDGVLILASAILYRQDKTPLSVLSGMFGTLPRVSIGLKLPGLPGILVNARKSMMALMEHLVDEHRYRRFLFVGGPPTHHDSLIRERAFIEALERKRGDDADSGGDGRAGTSRIAWEIIYSDFTEDSAYELMREYIAIHPADLMPMPDAIVAANDNMAIGVMKALKLQDDPAWQGRAVTGFDDTPQAAASIPPLTSIRQPLEEEGVLALRTLLEIIAASTRGDVPSPRVDAARPGGTAFPWNPRIETRLVLRDSCGCSHRADGSGDGRPLESKLRSVQREAFELERRLGLVNEFGQELNNAYTTQDILDHLRLAISRFDTRSFFLLLFEDDPSDPRRLPAYARLLYMSSGGTDRVFGNLGLRVSIDDFFAIAAGGSAFNGSAAGLSRSDGAGREEPTPSRLCVRHLHSGLDQLGLIVWDSADWAHGYLCAVAVHLANAIKRVRVLAERETRSRQLEILVERRTMDLRSTNAMLEEEIRRRTAVEKELRRHRQTLESILDAMPMPVVVAQLPDRLVRYANKAFYELAEALCPEIPVTAESAGFAGSFIAAESSTPQGLAAPENATGAVRVIGETLDAWIELPEEAVAVEHVFIRSLSGEAIPVLLSWRPIQYEGGDSVIAAITDLRAQKALESDILRISEFERHRFGLDLHDDICQRLAGISMYANVIAMRLGKEGGDAKEAAAVAELGRMVDETLQQTRLYAHASFPVSLRELGLDAILRGLCERVAKQTGGECLYESDLSGMAGPFNDEQEINLYRIAQEAVQNATRHAKATEIRVSLRAFVDSCELRIEDNGEKPYEPEAHGSGGMGMRSMKYRASQIGSRLVVAARPGGGTKVSLVFALDPPNGAMPGAPTLSGAKEMT